MDIIKTLFKGLFLPASVLLKKFSCDNWYLFKNSGVAKTKDEFSRDFPWNVSTRMIENKDLISIGLTQD
ncbi:hypothetical protein [Anabaena sp. UHCC 0253]|uniref:hypothetical protein n=1 Tax=Anabaena sp. UHCC 0253 TaxID=2590019 RepID=UPI001446296B|nr:hypothetical protein [Anabaena sp. UHCC 0253]